MRLFIGLDLPAHIKENLGGLIERLRPAGRLRWSTAGNLHITTKFIGEWPGQRLEEMKAALAGIEGIPSIPIAIRGLGWFPNPHRPRVLWAAVRAPESLAELARATEDAAFQLGVARENRPFAPHLTLARIQDPAVIGQVRHRVAELDSVDFGEFTATEFHLYRSQIIPGGSVYTKLASYSLEPL
jgi:2'-5' RNA ligase